MISPFLFILTVLSFNFNIILPKFDLPITLNLLYLFKKLSAAKYWFLVSDKTFIDFKFSFKNFAFLFFLCSANIFSCGLNSKYLDNMLSTLDSEYLFFGA